MIAILTLNIFRVALVDPGYYQRKARTSSITFGTLYVSIHQHSSNFSSFHKVPMALLEEHSYVLHSFNEKDLLPFHMSLKKHSATLHSLQRQGIKSFVLSI